MKQNLKIDDPNWDEFAQKSNRNYNGVRFTHKHSDDIETIEEIGHSYYIKNADIKIPYSQESINNSFDNGDWIECKGMVNNQIRGRNFNGVKFNWISDNTKKEDVFYLSIDKEGCYDIFMNNEYLGYTYSQYAIENSFINGTFIEVKELKIPIGEQKDLPYFDYKGNTYLDIQRKGFAAQFSFPFSQKICLGQGVDVGCMKKDWALPDSYPVDLSFDDGYHALNLPKNTDSVDGEWDYIFSSHCLEHLNDWVGVLNYWWDNLKEGGVIFLYLPDYSQEYWRCWNNRKHVNVMQPQVIKDYFIHKSSKKVFTSGVDLYNSFTVVAFK